MDEEKKVDEEELKEEEANTKAAHVLGKGAATYFGGPLGNKIYNAADRLGVAKPIEKLAGKAISYNPALNQASKMLNNTKVLDAADKAIDIAGGDGKGLSKDGLAKETLAKEGLEDSASAATKGDSTKSSSSSSASSGSSSGTGDAEKESKFPKWLFLILGIIIFFPLILLLIVLIIVIVGFLAPGLGVIDFFSGIADFFNNEEALLKAEAEYYDHLYEAQQNAFLKYNVCIDVNLIHATLTVDKLGDTTLDEGEELCSDLESCNNEFKDVLTVSDYRKMEKYIDVLVNMQIKRKKYSLFTTDCYTSSHGDRCAEGKSESKEVKVTAENLHCADISWLDSFDLSWQGIPFRDSSTPRKVAQNDKETIFKFFSKKANREKNYEYYLYIPAADYIKNKDGTETRNCKLIVPNDVYDNATLDIGDWNKMEEHIYFYNLLDSFIEEYYPNYLNTGDGEASEGSERYEQAKKLIDRIYDYYTLLGENRNCSYPSEYICRDDEGSDYYGGGDTSLKRSEFIERIAPIAIDEMERTGVLASITIAQAVLESSSGSSGLSTKYANYYGMTAGNCAPSSNPAAYKGQVFAPGQGGNTCSGNAFWNGSIVAMCNSRGADCQWYRIYDSFKNSTMDHSRLLTNSRYQLNNYSTLDEQLDALVAGGYATDKNYKKKVKKLISDYNLTQYDIGSFDGTIEPITDPQYTDQLCVEGSVIGDWANWKQYDPRWSGVPLGPYTVGKIGCAMTSVAIQIARSGVQTTLGSNFNPGTFAQEMTRIGGFNGAGEIYWNKVSQVAPNFHFVSRGFSTNVSQVNQFVNQGYYVILQVKGGRHWVAVDRVEGNKIYMFDPGSGGNEVGHTYGLGSIKGYTLYKKG